MCIKLFIYGAVRWIGFTAVSAVTTNLLSFHMEQGKKRLWRFITFPIQITSKRSSSLPICCCFPAFLMDGSKQSSFLINAVNQVNVNGASRVRAWQFFGSGMLGNAAFLPPDLEQSDGHSHPTKNVEEQGVLTAAPSPPCSPNPDTSVWIAGGLRVELRLEGACFIHRLAHFIFRKRHRRTRMWAYLHRNELSIEGLSFWYRLVRSLISLVI